MKNIHILTLIEPIGFARKSEFVQIGIPLPKAQYYSTDQFQLVTENRTPLLCEFTPTVLWDDNSIKWCLLKFNISFSAYQTEKLFFRQNNTPDKVKEREWLIQDELEIIQIKTKNYEFLFNKKYFNFIDEITKNNSPITQNGFLNLLKNNSHFCKAKIDDLWYRTAYSESTPIFSELNVSGKYISKKGKFEANFEASFNFHYETDTVKCSMSIHNPRQALHPSGLWDLGDKNSLFIDEFSVGFESIQETEIVWQAKKDKIWNKLKSSSLSIYQESSGGDNWKSPNHKNKNNKVPLKQKGYSCSFSNNTKSGKRASPFLSIKSTLGCINIHVEKFWQNFPKSIDISNKTTKISLFPERFPDMIELQPGEKKTHEFYLNFSDQTDFLYRFYKPIEIQVNLQWLQQSSAIPHIFSTSKRGDIDNIIQEGLTGKNSFFNKREVIDEYGWRNFGEIYADHENDGNLTNDRIISHYNNQYDPLYGFLMQYLKTGKQEWFELANDLANHITDIDIYQTDKDKDDYNGGLFWHTDHYLDAGIASHRTYSSLQPKNAYQDHSGGGGPAGQHCYTSGLLYHYLLTGNKSSKKGVLIINNWISNYYEGTDSFLDFLNNIRRGDGSGKRNRLTNRYPLDRGTGNYINALIDKYIITNESQLIFRIAYIIKNTIHPDDNVDSRNLDNVEENWFYTVFLLSVTRYLQLKVDLNELDMDFYYARDALLNYANWMVMNEYNHLEKPEILEYPNHTWSAQELRKVNVLMFAALFAHDDKGKYVKKSEELFMKLIADLKTEPTRTYTRILTILMQNYGYRDYLQKTYSKGLFSEIKSYPIPANNKYNRIKSLLSNLIKILGKTSISREVSWLRRNS